MKHRLQWKFIAIMLVSLLCGVSMMSIMEYIVFQRAQGITHNTGTSRVDCRKVFCFI